MMLLALGRGWGLGKAGTRTKTLRQPAGADACPMGKGFRLRPLMGRRGDVLRLVRADTAALRKSIRANPG